MKDIKIYQCNVCEYISQDESDVKDCCPSYQKTDGFECEICGNIFDNKPDCSECELQCEYDLNNPII